MILGIGSDMIDIRRIERVIARHGQRFLARIFTDEELHYAESRPRLFAATLAKRFAAKEACAKALGTGLGHGVYWKDMGVVRVNHGPPVFRLTGGAARRLHALAPAGCTPQIHVTLTDEFPQALAFVVISATAN